MLQWMTVFLFMFTCFVWGFGTGEVYIYFQDSNSIEQHDQESR